MSQFRIGLICSDPTVLPYLATRLGEAWCTILEEDGIYYWLSSRFESLATCEEVDKFSDRWLPTLNGLVKLYIANESPLIKAGIITYIDEQGQLQKYRRFSSALLVTYKISDDAHSIQNAEHQWLELMEMHLKEDKNSLIADVLRYYTQETSWESLYQVYETIRWGYNKSKGITDSQKFVALPVSWTQDGTGRNRKKDFTESANNANLSGIAARHSLSESNQVVKVADSSIVKVVPPRGKERDILPMSLKEAKTFITNILIMWLTGK